MLVCLVTLLAAGCGNSERGDDTGVIRQVKRARQAKLKPHDFAFAKLQVHEGGLATKKRQRGTWRARRMQCANICSTSYMQTRSRVARTFNKYARI